MDPLLPAIQQDHDHGNLFVVQLYIVAMDIVLFTNGSHDPFNFSLHQKERFYTS